MCEIMKSRIILITLLLIAAYSLKSQSDHSIEIRRFAIDLEEGQFIGNSGNSSLGEEIVIKDRNYQYGREFRYSSSFTEDNLKKFISEAFVAKNIKVKGYGNLFYELDEKLHSIYSIAFVLNDLKFKYEYNGLQYNKSFHSNMKILVKVLDLRTDQLIYTKEVNTEYYSDEIGFSYSSEDFANYFDKALDKFVDQLLIDSDFNAIVTNEVITDITKFDTPISIATSTRKDPFAIKKALESVVTISTGSGHGSGAIISSNGLILTCHHNIYSMNEVEVIFSNGIKAKAKVLRKAPEYDIVLLQLSEIITNPIYLSKRKQVDPGEEAWVIGTPGFTDLGQTITKGVISGNRIIDNREYIQTDASVSPGNSGGPLLDANGEIIGIVNAKVVAKGMEGIGFAIPISVALEKLNIIVE